MRGLRQMLLQEQNYLENMVNKAKTGLSTAPDGHLRISKDKNKVRYYHCTEDNSGMYIPKSNKYLPQKLAQKTYNLSVIKKAETRLKQIKKITRDYSDDEIEELYTSLHSDRQALIAPGYPQWQLAGLMTPQSGSVWPTAFLHAAHNNYDQSVFQVITAGDNKMYFISETGVLTILCAWVLAAIMYIRAKKQTKHL